MAECKELRNIIKEYTSNYGETLTLVMLVRAIENFEEQGGLDPLIHKEPQIPRAGNWSGQYTHLWEPIRIALKVPSWRDWYK